MAKGRPPKPVEQHILSGTFRADRHSDDIPKPLVGIPTCPKELSDPAKSVWRALVKTMKDTGVLTKADVWTMRRFCTAVARLIAAEAVLDQFEMTALLDDEASTAIKKLYVIIRGETETMTTLGALLGLDPVSRTRLHVGSGRNDGPAVPAVRGPDLDLPPPTEDVG